MPHEAINNIHSTELSSDMGDYAKGTRVFVGGLGESIKKEDLESEFTKYGKLNSVWVAFNPPGFAFIEFDDEGEAEKACDHLNGIEIMGSKLRVEIARGRRTNRGGFRGGRGGGGGRGYSRGGSGGSYRGGSYSDRGGSYYGGRGGSGGGRGRGRYDDYSSRGGSSYGRERSREGPRESYRGRDRGYSSGGGIRGGRGGYDEGSRYRSRSPVARGSSRECPANSYGSRSGQF